MTATIQHTPLPWVATWTHKTRCVIQSTSFLNPGVIAVVLTGTGDADYSSDAAKLNADYLVKAANLFPELVAACEAAKRALRATSERAKDYSGELKALNEVLRKVAK